MKKLLFITLIFNGLCSTSFAQQNNHDTSQATMNDYERMLEAQLQVNFRNHAIETLELTEDQIIAFDPIYRNYMNEKEEIFKRKENILNNLSEKMKEDVAQSEKKQKWAGAVENYWETEINLSKLQKNYFDRLEDVITPTKALQFFLMEDAVQTRIHELRLAEVMPMIIEIERMPGREYGSDIPGDSTRMNNNSNWNNNMNRDTMNNNYNNSMNNQMPRNDNRSNMNNNDMMGKRSVDEYDTWFTQKGMTIGKGKADLSHQHIYDGLTKLVTAVESIAMATNTNVTNMSSQKNQIMQLANELTKNPQSTQHADKARQAFMMAAELMSNVREQTDFDDAEDAVEDAEKAAQNINSSELLTNQLNMVNNFFQHAQTAVNKMAKEVKWTESNRK